MALGRRQFWCTAAAVGWLGLSVRPVAADGPRIIGEVPRTAQRFADAAALEKQQHWTEAVDAYLRLIDEAADDLVPADGAARHLLPSRGLVHRRLAAHTELLIPYRARVEGRAKRLLEQGASNRDAQLLEQVVDQFFCSRSADSALQLLGDLACERGDFEQARRCWRMLEPTDSPHGLAYPDPQGGPALARGKQILALLLNGDRSEAEAALNAFRKLHAEAIGHLAGHDGNLAGILQGLLDTAENVRVPSPYGIATSPTTFAGDASRNGVLHGVLPPFSPEPKYPPISLTKANSRHTVQPPTQASALAYYPVIANGQVFVADARRLQAFDLATGQLSGRYVGAIDFAGGVDEQRTPIAAPTFTLTVAGDRIYARFGQQNLKAASALVCLQWRPEQGTPESRLLLRWVLPAAKPDSETTAAWEGPPVVRDGKLFAAVTRIDGARVVTAIACYPAADPTAGAIWQKDVYELAGDTTNASHSHLLTLADRNVILCSDAGVIVGLDAATGRRAWALRYPPGDGNVPSCPNPCISAAGRLFVAPFGAERVWCLDAASGAPIWTSEPVNVGHLLGAVHGRVVCALGGFHSGLCALDATTGRRLADWGYRVTGSDALAPFGRGLLCEDRVYWPTRAAGINELRWDGTTGYPPTAFRELPGGNLAYGDGCLAVATADRLHVLVGSVPEVMGPGHRVGKRSMEERHELMMWRADMLRRTGRPAAQVRAAFDEAATPEFPPERRFLALVRRAEFEQTMERKSAFAVADSDLRNVVLRDARGVIRSAKNWSGPGEPAASAAGLARHPAIYAAGSPADKPLRLRLPLAPVWRLPLDRGKEWALLPEHESEPGRIFVASRNMLSCRNAEGGAETWRAGLSFSPTWVAAVNGSLIVAGDNGAARLSATDGLPVWQFRLPDAAPWFDLPGWRDPNAVPSRERLTSFHWAGDRLVMRLGARSFLVIDGIAGQILWQRSAPFGSRFGSNFFVDDQCVVLQSTDGRCWVYDARTGRILHCGPAPTEDWPTPPVALDDRRIVVVDEGRLVALNRSDWKPSWKWHVPRELSLTGELPRIRMIGEILLVGVPRNDAFEIERLDPATGQSLSEVPLAVSRGPIDLDAIAIDGDQLFVAAEGELKVVDCRTGAVKNRQLLSPSPDFAGEGRAVRRKLEPVADGFLLGTVPPSSPNAAPLRSGEILFLDRSQPERERGKLSSLPLGLGPENTLRSFDVRGNEVVVVSDAEVRGFRGTNREVK